MEKFIKKQQSNYINEKLRDLENTFKNCLDSRMVDINKDVLNEKINNIFENLSEENRLLLDFRKINNNLDINKYSKTINQYVYGMPKISEVELSSLFKKLKNQELKKIIESQDKDIVYLSWQNNETNKLYIVYYMDSKFRGMECKIVTNNSNNKNICLLCGNMKHDNKVAFVSTICKSRRNSKATYRSIGFLICLDGKRCNENITDTSKLEYFISKANALE